MEEAEAAARRGRQQKATTGKLPLAFKPYVYDYDPEASLLVINQEEAQVVKDMFRWLLEEGEKKAVMRLCPELFEEGYTGQAGGGARPRRRALARLWWHSSVMARDYL